MTRNNPICDKKGVTMVELIVTFALISIFVVLSGQIIASAITVYTRIQNVEYGKQVSDTIMNKIAGELSGAQVASIQYDSPVSDPAASPDPYTIKLYNSDRTVSAPGKGCDTIEFRDENGSRVKIHKGRPKSYSYNATNNSENATSYDNNNPVNWDKQLIVHYFVTKSGTGAEAIYEPVDWTFDKKIYQGFHIEKLTFSRPDYNVYPWNIIKVELELASDAHGTYKTTRYIECYNFKDYEEKITEDGNPVPATPTPAPPSPTAAPTP